jgi:hypothetical protein
VFELVDQHRIKTKNRKKKRLVELLTQKFKNIILMKVELGKNKVRMQKKVL